MAHDEDMSHGHGRARDVVHAAGRRAHHCRRGGGPRGGAKLFGILLIALGAILLLSNLDLINLRLMFRTIWPLALVACGIHQMLTCRSTGRVFGIGLMAFGTLLFLDRLFGWAINVWGFFWPALLILFGIHTVRRRPA